MLNLRRVHYVLCKGKINALELHVSVSEVLGNLFLKSGKNQRVIICGPVNF